MLSLVPKVPITFAFAVIALIAISVAGCGRDEDASSMGPPTGKTGNQQTEDDYATSSSELALKGGPEFVAYCREAGNCELQGVVLDKFKEILAKYPVKDDEEYDHFSVVLRQRLIEAGLLPEGDPERYQYKVSALAIALGTQ